MSLVGLLLLLLSLPTTAASTRIFWRLLYWCICLLCFASISCLFCGCVGFGAATASTCCLLCESDIAIAILCQNCCACKERNHYSRHQYHFDHLANPLTWDSDVAAIASELLGLCYNLSRNYNRDIPFFYYCLVNFHLIYRTVVFASTNIR